MLLSSCTTVERVESCVSAGALYCLTDHRLWGIEGVLDDNAMRGGSPFRRASLQH